MIIQSLEFDRQAFDFRDIFFRDAEGKEDKVLASKYSDYETWYTAQVEDTKNDFADLFPWHGTSAQLDKVNAIAEKIFEKVKWTVNNYNPIPLFFDKKSGTLYKTLEAHEIQGGRVYGYTYGGYRRMSALKHVTYTLSTKPDAAHFGIPMEQLSSGRYSISDFVMAASQAILRAKITLAYNTLVAAYTAGGAYATNTAGAINSTNLSAAINAVADQGVGGIAVVGRYSKLTPINSFSGFADPALEEIRRTGLLGRFLGAGIQPLFYDVDPVYGTQAFGTSSVFVTSNQKNGNRFVEAKPLTRTAWVVNEDGTYHIKFEYEDGAAVWKPQYGHRMYGIS